MAKIIAFAPAEHKVGSGQFGGFSLAVGLWLGFTEVILVKFPVEFVCKLNHLFPQKTHCTNSVQYERKIIVHKQLLLMCLHF